MGVMYFRKSDQPYSLSQVLSRSLFHKEDDTRQSEYIEAREYQSDGETGDKKTEKSKAWYEEIAGIDPDKAIENSGSEDAFRSVLKIFFESLDQRENEITDYYIAEDWKDYTIKVHALKSSARLVGAMELGDFAEKLEKAGKEGNTDYIRNNNEQLIGQLRKFKDVLAPVCGSDKADDDERFDKILIKSAYETLIKAASEKDDRMIEMTLTEISEYDIPEKHKERMDRIRLCFERRDYDEIITLSGIAEGIL